MLCNGAYALERAELSSFAFFHWSSCRTFAVSWLQYVPFMLTDGRAADVLNGSGMSGAADRTTAACVACPIQLLLALRQTLQSR